VKTVPQARAAAAILCAVELVASQNCTWKLWNRRPPEPHKSLAGWNGTISFIFTLAVIGVMYCGNFQYPLILDPADSFATEGERFTPITIPTDLRSFRYLVPP
jgi:hypothetical protein